MGTLQLFVYGTLRKHERNHSIIEGSRCIAKQAWVFGELFDTGNDYPTMSVHRSKKVYGELYEVDEAILPTLDQLEGYVPTQLNNIYDRVEMTVYTDFGERSAATYINGREGITTNVIDHGDWKLYHYLLRKPERTYYYAYGSCMDDERFRLAGINHCFEKLLGSATLNGYAMKYLFHAADGGRADIIEEGGQVEGLLYEVPYEGIEYLFQREGFYGGWYRPTFVDVVCNQKEFTNVLTFHVYEKKPELAPPEHYSTEILRGAKGRLSQEYYQKLQSDIERLTRLQQV